MTDAGDAAAAPSSSGAAPSFAAGVALPGRVRGLSSPTPPGRLTSLRTRDLTLGGAFKKPKKTFEPNVHAVRKSKDELKEETHVVPKKERWGREERRKEPRRRRNESPQTIQSHSIFEQGPADTTRRTGWRGATVLHDSTTTSSCKVVKKERKQADEEEEDEVLTKLQRDDFIDDPGLRNDAKLTPIQLPLSHSFSSGLSTTRPEPPAGCGGAEVSEAEHPYLAELLQELRLSDREELFFMQLPDSMPCRFVKEESSVLSPFSEGFLGKLQIRKSGKMELKLGDVVLDVCEGAAFSFFQELVSVRLSDGRKGDMMVLGNVHRKLVLSPDFHALVRQAKTQQQQGP